MITRTAGRLWPPDFSEDVKPEPFVPLEVTPHYPSPKYSVDPDTSKTWLRRCFPLIRAHRLTFTTAMVLSFATLAIAIQIPNVLRLAINNSIQTSKVPISHYVWILAGLIVLRAISNYVSRRTLLSTAFALEYDLRNLIYGHLTKMSFSFYDTVQSGQLISRANSDITALQRYLVFAPAIVVQCSVVVLAFVEMLIINVPLALLTMAAMPLTYFLGLAMRKKIWPISWLIQARLADVATIVSENVNGVRVVKSFAAEQRELTSLAGAAERLQWAYVKDADVRATWAPAMENLPRMGLAFILFFGGIMALHNPALIGTIVAFNGYMLMIQPPFRQLGMVIMLGQRARTSSQRIYEILDHPAEVVDRPGAVDLLECRGDVVFDDVTFAYGKDGPVLEDLDLHLSPGETLVLVGRTGSGKSTVARLLNRSYDITSGSLRIDGTDVRDYTLRSLRNRVGIVLDEPFLFSASVRDNIAYGRPDATDEEVRTAAKAAGADGFISLLSEGYDTVVGERGYTLSGGQRQRIAIARTLVQNPPILVLDDATSAIDVQVEQEIHRQLRTLMENRTTLIIAHRLSTISLADRVCLLEDGRILAIGTHAELLATEPHYSEVLAQVQAEEEAEAEDRSDVEVTELHDQKAG